MKTRAVLALALVCVGLSAAPPVAVVVEHGPMLPHRGTARLKVTVTPHSGNRGLWTAIEATGYSTAHYEQLEGADSPRTRWTEFKDLPDGNYTAWARVVRVKDEHSASARFIVGRDLELPE
jgi:hypothetical protein